MKFLEGAPYDNYEQALNYLRANKIIGNEGTEYNGVFHLHWRGPIDNDKVILQIKSTLATQEVKEIIFWIEDNMTTMMSSRYHKLLQFNKFVKIKIFNRDVLNQASGEQKIKDKIWEYYNRHHAERRYKTDIFRFIVLNIYGGVYTDADTLLLRDVRDIRLKNWSSSWGAEGCAEACILKLEKGNDAYEQIYLNNPNNPMCFLAFDGPRCLDYKHDNIDLTPLPCSFFDIMWGNDNKDVDGLKFSSFADFFEETNRKVAMDNFLKGCFAYHWHNKWELPELKNSYAGKLNEDLDKIIENKYGIKPIKIFQG